MAVTIEQARDLLLTDIKQVANAKDPIFEKDGLEIGRGENLRDFAEGVLFLEKSRILELA